ncbi:MAG TPA: hypothetical protein PLS00_18280 [Niabella sp.]|nr:hypothetical protein [Niabella sp.]
MLLSYKINIAGSPNTKNRHLHLMVMLPPGTTGQMIMIIIHNPATFSAYSPMIRKNCYKNTAAQVGGAQKFIQIRHILNCYKANPAYDEGVAKALGLTMDEVNSFQLER